MIRVKVFASSGADASAIASTTRSATNEGRATIRSLSTDGLYTDMYRLRMSLHRESSNLCVLLPVD